MNTLTEHLQLERDVETPTVEVPTLDAFLVEDGDVMEAQHVRTGTWACHCIDKRCRDIDREELADADSWLPKGAHRVPVHIYAVVGPPITERPTIATRLRDVDIEIARLVERRNNLIDLIEENYSVSPRKDKKVHFLADDPNLPTVAESEAQIAKDAEKARRHVARKFPGEAGKAETDEGKGLWGSLGIGKGKR